MSGYSEIDLHTHSNKSDGELSPAELISKAANNGIRILALTDHDTVSGLKDAKKAAIKNGMTPLRDAGIEKIINGSTTIDEVLRATVEDI